MAALRLREWRRYRALTMCEVAEAVGLSKGAVCDLEMDLRRTANVQHIAAFASAFGCGPADLFFPPPSISVLKSAVVAPTAPKSLQILETVTRGAVLGFMDWLTATAVRLFTTGRPA